MLASLSSCEGDKEFSISWSWLGQCGRARRGDLWLEERRQVTILVEVPSGGSSTEDDDDDDAEEWM
jgi:hypothetical protein